MRPINKFIIFPDVNDIERSVHYNVWYETAPEYRGMSVEQLKKLFDFSRDESVPDIAIVKIVHSEYEFAMDNLKEEIMANEGITDSNEIVFE